MRLKTVGKKINSRKRDRSPQELTKIGGGHNRTARPFPTFGGGASSAPATAQLPMAYNSGGGGGGGGGGSYSAASSDTYQQQTQQRLQMSKCVTDNVI